ncbi:MAG: serine/threonine-protein kinase [Deltaproteobacteria bacterium]|nr:serine/threonine-protein kinase [Deltaproteobacteria bacterium]
MLGCADDEMLAEFERGALSPEQRGLLLDHASECAECRAAIAVLVDTAASGPGAFAPAPERAQIGRYALGPILGRGAMGVVYRARDPELDRDVAVKLLRPQASALRLRREAQALAKLAHPNVVRVYDVGEDDGQTFIAMELVVGDNLRQWLVTPRSRAEILDVLVRAGRGLAAAHAAGLVHRDFKPDNVLIARTGEVMVGDFGLARSAEPAPSWSPDDPSSDAVSSDALTATGTVLGTPAYMAPEQVGGEATPASDQFAFCATAWEALFGRRPFEGATHAELVANARAGVLARPPEVEVPRAVEAALRRGLSPDPSARFASIELLLGALSPRPRTRRVWLGGGALVAAGALAAAGAFWSTRAPAVNCAETSALLDPVWSDRSATALASKFDPLVADAFGRYATEWRAARVDACRATHERHEQTVEGLERRVACLDRARDQLALTLGDMMAATAEDLPHAAEIVSTLPSLARCTPTLAAPNATQSAAGAALDAELTRLAINLAAGNPALPMAEATALRERADAIGDVPQVLRARTLEARNAAWNGDLRGAEAGLRDVMVRAEQAGDDFARASAGASLALLIATRPDEATAVVTAAHATLRRAGSDPTIEQQLLEAEVAIASARGDHRMAAEIQTRVVAMIEARSPEASDELINAYSRLAASWSIAGDLPRWTAANRRADELIEAVRVRLGVPAVYSGATPKSYTMRGDFAGAVARARAMIAAMRAEPQVPYFTVGQMLDEIALAYAMDHDYVQCLAAYREAEEAWSLPPDRYAFPPAAPDLVAISQSRLGALLGAADCLHSLGRYDEQIATLRRARELAEAGGAHTTDELAETGRALGIALVATGQMHEARALLEPIAAHPETVRPLPRAAIRFALAQALWLDGGLGDRPRAVALAADAAAELQALIAVKPAAALRKLPARASAILEEIRAWQATHAVTPSAPPP